jgi:hypothetical protein
MNLDGMWIACLDQTTSWHLAIIQSEPSIEAACIATKYNKIQTTLYVEV